MVSVSACDCAGEPLIRAEKHLSGLSEADWTDEGIGAGEGDYLLREEMI